MPAPSMFDKRAEITQRTLVRHASPVVTPRASSPTVHRGLMYADGTPLKGGRMHVARSVTKHDIINPPPPPADGSYFEPTSFLPGGQAVVLGRKSSANVGGSRSSSPAVSVCGATHGTGKRHVSPGPSIRDSPIRHDGGRSSSSSTPVRLHKILTPGPRDHAIVGVCGPAPGTPTESQRETPRGQRHLTGSPQFVPPPFEKKPYTPQTKRVVTKRIDNDIFLTQSSTEGGSSTTPQPQGVSLLSTPRGLNPHNASATATPSSLMVGAGVVRGYKEFSVTPGRSPAPPPFATDCQRPITPVRSSTPRRTMSPGSCRYNIITGQPL